MTPGDRTTFDADQAVMLEIVKGFDPETRRDHTRQHHCNRHPAAEQPDDALHDDLRQ